MKRFHLLLIMVVILIPTYTQAKGSSYPRATPIPIVVSLVNPAPPSSSGDQRHFSGDCSGACRSRVFRRAKGSFQ